MPAAAGSLGTPVISLGKGLVPRRCVGREKTSMVSPTVVPGTNCAHERRGGFRLQRVAWLGIWGATAILFAALGSVTAVRSQSASPSTPASALHYGDTAVSGFSGAALSADSIPPGVDPIDRTIIDVNGASLRIFDLSSLGTAPAGQLITPPIKLEVPAKDIGQVFALVAADGPSGAPPSLYAAATSAYGLQIVGGTPDSEGKPVRLKSGAPGARFMEGQFGGLPGGGPGSIWKVDSATGAVTLFANATSGGRANSGPGIGGLAFDPQGRNIYASDLDSGLIHRFSLENSADGGTFDHGVSGRPAHGGAAAVADDGTRMDITSPAFKPGDVATWGMTQPERRVHALAVQQGRLYYAVAAGSEIWSVDLNPDGSFGADARFEVAVKALAPLPVTSIVFDSQGRMLLAQRGAPKSAYDYGSLIDGEGARVLRYLPAQSPARWATDPQAYAVGAAEGSRMSAGGVGLQYGYTPDGQLDVTSCEKTLLMTGDHLFAGSVVDGVQVSAADLVLPADAPGTSVVFDFDGHQDDPAARGHVGGVVTIHSCGGPGGSGTGLSPLADEGEPPVVDSASGSPPVVDSGAGGGAAVPPVVDSGAGEAAPPVVDGGGGGAGEGAPPIADEAAPGGVVVTKKAAAAKCTAADGCPFEITVTNNGATDLPGPIFLKDEVTETGSQVVLKPFLRAKPPAPWTCPNTHPFICQHPGPLPTGQSLSLMLVVEPSDSKNVTEVKNCASISTPVAGGTPPALPAPIVNEAGSAGLKVVGKALTPKCSPTAGGCEFEAIVTNVGAEPKTGAFSFSGSVMFVDDKLGGNVPPRVTLQSSASTPEMACGIRDGHIVSCQHSQLSLAPNQSVSLRYTVKAEETTKSSREFLLSGMAASLSSDVNIAGAANVAIPLDPPLIDGLPAPLHPPLENAGAPACATISGPAAPPGEQPAPGDQQPAPGQAEQQPAKNVAQLKIEKHATTTTCSALGGGCDFSITVTNPGPGDVAGPIEIDEQVTAGTSEIIATTQFVDVPKEPWKCLHGGNGRFSCTHPGPLKAGESTELGPLRFRLGTATAQTHIRNCATIKGTTSKPCAEILLSKPEGPKLRIRKELTAGPCEPHCEFKLTVTNVGGSAYKGPLSIFDVLSPKGQQGGGIKAEIHPSGTTNFTCKTVAAGFFLCEHPNVVLEPGTLLLLRLDMKITEPATKIEGQNCARVSLKGELADNEQPDRCVPINATLPPRPNLQITKEAPNANVPGGEGHCDLNGLCRFQIAITNIGPGEFKAGPGAGEIIVNDHVVGPGATPDSMVVGAVPESLAQGPGSPAGWTCQNTLGANGLRCTHSGSFTFAVGGSLRLEVAARAGKTWKNSINNIMQNCAEVQYTWLDEKGERQPAEVFGPAKAKACARARLDPYALKIDKTGSQSCQPGGECRFDLTIFNNGPIPHDDPVTIVDGIGGDGLQSAEIVSITPPLPCPQQPTRIPFQCTVPKMKLNVGDKFTHTMVVRIPDSAKSFRNCAIISSPETAAARTEAPPAPGTPVAEATDCHDVAVEPQKTTEPGPPSCTAGMVLVAADRCACAAGTVWTGRACTAEAQPLPPPPLAPAPPPAPRPPPVAKFCSGDRPVGTYPNCCPRGTRYDARRDRCTWLTSPESTPPPAPPRVCPGDRPVGAYPNCCPRGTRYDARRDRCTWLTSPESTPPPAPPRVCPGDRPVGAYPNCCPRGTRYDARRDRCVRPPSPEPTPTPPRICTGDRPVGTYPNCCPRGYEYVGGACRRPQQPLPPADGGGIKDRLKTCPDGSKIPRWKRCPSQPQPAPQPQPQPPKQPVRCPPGQIGRPPYCRPIKKPAPSPTPAPAKCPPGTYGTPPKCTGILR